MVPEESPKGILAKEGGTPVEATQDPFRQGAGEDEEEVGNELGTRNWKVTPEPTLASLSVSIPPMN